MCEAIHNKLLTKVTESEKFRSLELRVREGEERQISIEGPARKAVVID